MGLLQASHSIEIAAPLDHVYAVAADVSKAPEWQPSVVDVVVLETHPDGTAALAEMHIDAVVKKSKTVLRYDYTPPTGLTWKQEKGEVKSLVGSWQLEELDGELTRATYSLESDTGRVIGLMLRGPVEGKVKDFLTRGAAEGLKEFCE